MNKRNVLTAVCMLTALLAALRIFLFLRGTGAVYTMGIFPLALLFGLYCLWKKALFFEEVFFSVPVRMLLAAAFTVLQVLGVCWSHPGTVRFPEAVLWVIGLSPLCFAGQNMAFVWAARAAVERETAAGQTAEAERKATGERKTTAGRVAAKQPGQRPKSFWIAFGVIFAGFCIPFAAYYPAIMAYDVIPQLDQIRSSGLTTHHPLIHTLWLAACLRAGEVLPFANGDRAGLAMYSLLQMAVVAGCFAFVYTFLLRQRVNRRLCDLFVLCAALFPTHGMLAVSITKDTVYGALVMVFTVYVYELSTRKENPGGGWTARYILLSVLLLLFRNNSVYAWVLYVIAAAFATRKRKPFFKRICAFHGVILLLYIFCNGLMIRGAMAGNDTYAREMLSVPAQQIARVVQYHKEELTGEDLAALSAVWQEGLPEYVPAIADRSKRDIPNDMETLRIFAGEWASLGHRYPGEYVKAFLLKNKGMWDMTDVSYLNDVYSYAKGYLQITYPSDQQPYMEALAPGYTRHQKLQPLQSLYRYFAAGDELWRYCPPLAMVMQPAFYCYLLLFYCLCCIGLKKPALLLPAVYLLSLLGTLLLGPCVLVRYLYPVMLSVPVLVGVLFCGSAGNDMDVITRIR